ncbi:carboxylesterase family protein [Rudanella paleaurantiibacter]|uniref:Carboxylic ester hydrolase n=1 Tax=Rudanella paleaurantiibacter TaxID=2614655 RepID=A0A7J5U3W7_9BACT|nr:carboxylesterase family protein [Rudanella paleaurantiibacter]KAB7732431.1 carboxylesterase family protein [Rudanella paleaurantiibacter]
MKKSFMLLLGSLLVVAAALAFRPALRDTDPVAITGGRISGTHSTQGDVQIFRGIPFAAPPVGNLRWKAPQPVQPWTGVRRCDTFGPSPVQGVPAPFGPWSAEYLIPKEPIGEDCLYLNVWTQRRSGPKQPVLVWVYGGGFNSGGSGVPIYDGEAMARKGIVFVSFNYRVGSLGFFAHPELTRESGRGASGNYGLMDQVAALRWVNQNIAQFGGDPNNVTIAGQSAGSMSVNCLVATPLAKGLFQKAIAQSGANMAAPGPSLQQAEESGVKLAQALGATTLADLRALPASQIIQKAAGTRGPIVDGYVLPQPIPAIFAARQQNDVVLLTGWNEDEGMRFGPPQTAEAYRKQIEQQQGPNAADFLQHYPANTDAEAATSQMRVSRDMIFGAQNYAWANLQSRQGKPVFVYRFRRKVPATGEYAHYGAFHTGEVAYAYDNLRFIDKSLRPLQPADDELARQMSAYWANFIRTGNPNGTGLPTWPAYSVGSKQVLMLDTQIGAHPLPDSAALDFLFKTMSRP